ncbi:unnamed protein product [Protopolystoma xenopodis]|uniref:Uncharacterized protein n=1 Tax=Protopolystoma xenopodis TaxID=117903 RepID=A0A3S5AEM7_9PLAT|nr:unnamed protein product [Protopolystoma xenopodis]
MTETKNASFLIDIFNRTERWLSDSTECRDSPEGGTSYDNRAWGWWVSRKGQPRFYWGGAVPGLQKCACGVEATCTGDSDTCNCDSTGSISPPLVDTGLLTFKVTVRLTPNY